ncbi:unnamed protein product, partial [Phaeothamnion confervicola]
GLLARLAAADADATLRGLPSAADAALAPGGAVASLVDEAEYLAAHPEEAAERMTVASQQAQAETRRVLVLLQHKKAELDALIATATADSDGDNEADGGESGGKGKGSSTDGSSREVDADGSGGKADGGGDGGSSNGGGTAGAGSDAGSSEVAPGDDSGNNSSGVSTAAPTGGGAVAGSRDKQTNATVKAAMKAAAGPLRAARGVVEKLLRRRDALLDGPSLEAHLRSLQDLCASDPAVADAVGDVCTGAARALALQRQVEASKAAVVLRDGRGRLEKQLRQMAADWGGDPDAAAARRRAADLVQRLAADDSPAVEKGKELLGLATDRLRRRASAAAMAGLSG